MKTFIASLLSLILSFSITATAEESVDISSFQPILNKRSKLLNANKLVKGEGESGHGKDWVIGHKKWELMDGGLFSGRKVQDDHSAGLRSAVGVLPNRLILEYQFRFDETPENKGKHKLNVRFMGAGKALVFSPTKSLISLYTQNEEKKYQTLVKKKVDLKKGVWYSVILEIRDEKCCLQMSDVGVLKASHRQIKSRTKKFMVFNVSTAQASFRNVKLWKSE
jgi:hypothetical protein